MEVELELDTSKDKITAACIVNIKKQYGKPIPTTEQLQWAKWLETYGSNNMWYSHNKKVLLGV
jgi:hypothetical protein